MQGFMRFRYLTWEELMRKEKKLESKMGLERFGAS